MVWIKVKEVETISKELKKSTLSQVKEVKIVSLNSRGVWKKAEPLILGADDDDSPIDKFEILAEVS